MGAGVAFLVFVLGMAILHCLVRLSITKSIDRDFQAIEKSITTLKIERDCWRAKAERLEAEILPHPLRSCDCGHGPSQEGSEACRTAGGCGK